MRRLRSIGNEPRAGASSSRRRRVLHAMAAGILFFTAPAAHAADVAFDLRLENGRAPERMRLIRVNEGDHVTLRFTTDRPLLLHLHGYDVEWRVQPGAVATIAFVARLTGRFPIEEHGAGTRKDGAHEDSPLVYVEVYPR